MPEVRTLRVQGDHYAMGWQHGQQVRELLPQIVEAMAARLSEVEKAGPDARFEALLGQTRELIEETDGPLFDLIRGQANGLGIDFDTLLRSNLAGNLSDDLIIRRRLHSEGCTTWAAAGSATADGQPMLAKNRDSTLEHLSLQCVIHATPEVGYRYLYITSAGSPGVQCGGINEAGLAVADSHVYSTDLGPASRLFADDAHPRVTGHSIGSTGKPALCATAWKAQPRSGRYPGLPGGL